jgi:hypothetical protein
VQAPSRTDTHAALEIKRGTPVFQVVCRGTDLASHFVVRKERAMTTEDNASGIRISNWTLASGTKPGDRCVYPEPPQVHVAKVEPVTKA